MATINKTIYGGVVALVGTTDTFQLVLPSISNVAFPHYLDNQVIEECYINCDTDSESCTINLPPISAFKGSWGAKFYISNLGGGEVVVNIGAPGQTINGFATFTIPATFSTGYFHVVDYDLWACFLTPGV